MTFPRPDASYWNDKLAAYLHDPIDKVFGIKGHEARAARQLAALGLQKPNDAFWKKADGIASGFERGQVPSHSTDPNHNGAVDFSDAPIITHPTAQNARLEILLPKAEGTTLAEKVGNDLLDFLRTNIGMTPGSGGYSDIEIFKNNPTDFAFARFLYVHLALRFKLAENHVAGLGGLWHRLPADSRFPDHTIWQHNALTSALYSCMSIAQEDNQVGILTFSITPVQPFIAKARKLRDYWTGSVILSWLAFEGLRWVMEYLGPDHLIYPSLIDQPLVNEYLRNEWRMRDVSSFSKRADIASLPNKFLCLVPLNQVEVIAAAIKQHVRQSWQTLCRHVAEAVIRITAEDETFLNTIFDRQTENYWELQWAAAKLIEKKDLKEARFLLPQGTVQTPDQVYQTFAEVVQKKWGFELDARGLLYTCSHQLAQIALAAGKTRKTITRSEEPGRKCPLCGEFEALHAAPFSGDMAAREYNANIDSFWKKLADSWGAEADLEAGEKLCTLCLTKRIAYRILKEDRTHILHACFDKAEIFPSTTEMALYDEFRRKQIHEKKEKQKIAQRLHDKEQNEELDNRDRYYAILVMDGDHMGRLINGETIGASWASAMHPQMKMRLENDKFDSLYRNVWQPLLQGDGKRLVTPAIHAAISESLGDFSIYGVADIIARHEGRLIYAGGDDVCAVMPVSTVVQAAREISRYYNAEFKLAANDTTLDVNGQWAPAPGKLSVNLGKNKNHISISAGILICHHKEGLSQMIARAHSLLENKAKDAAGRNACAIELRKRSGGSRFFIRKWSDDHAWQAFEHLGQWIKVKSKQKVSTSLVYRLEQFRDGVNAILEEENFKTLLSQFISKQLERSGIKAEKADEAALAAGIAEIMVAPDEYGKPTFQPEGLIVAAFIADTESEVQ